MWQWAKDCCSKIKYRLQWVGVAWQWLKNIYSKNKYWMQWVGIASVPLIWAIFFSWTVYGEGMPTKRDTVSQWMVSKFTISSFLISAAVLFCTMGVWKWKLLPKFSPFWMKFAAGSLLSANIGAMFSTAMWNCKIHDHYDENLLAGWGFLTWLLYVGIIYIMNRQKP